MKPAFNGRLAAQISKQLQEQFAPLNNSFTGKLSPQDMAAIGCKCNMGGSENGYFVSQECLGC